MTDIDPRLKKLDDLIQTGKKINEMKPSGPHKFHEVPSIPFYTWCTTVLQFLKDNFEPDFIFAHVFLEKVLGDADRSFPHQYFTTFGVNTLIDIRKYVIENPNSFKFKDSDEIFAVLQIYKNFHSAAIQLTRRKYNRPPYVIENEYDVQDLLHAFLIIAFGEVIKEEWSPSYCGASQRVDFLLKAKKLIIETKFATKKHKNKDIAEELVIDIAYFKNIPGCNQLSCLIYDPSNNIENPKIFISDLENCSTEDFRVFVDIIPKHW